MSDVVQTRLVLEETYVNDCLEDAGDGVDYAGNAVADCREGALDLCTCQ